MRAAGHERAAGRDRAHAGGACVRANGQWSREPAEEALQLAGHEPVALRIPVGVVAEVESLSTGRLHRLRQVEERHVAVLRDARSQRRRRRSSDQSRGPGAKTMAGVKRWCAPSSTTRSRIAWFRGNAALV